MSALEPLVDEVDTSQSGLEQSGLEQSETEPPGLDQAGPAMNQEELPDMDRPHLLNRLRLLVADVDPALDVSRIDDDSRPLRSVGLDSLALVGTVVRLEDEFRVRISDVEAMTATTGTDLLDLLQRKVAEARADVPARPVARGEA